jgi:ribosomal protein S18 acetylase RimI-like enzyme
MLTGRWGTPERPLLDLAVDESGNVSGVANPGRENAPIRFGKFDSATGAVRLEGEYEQDGRQTPFLVEGRLDGRTLRLAYSFGDRQGHLEMVRVEEFIPKPVSIIDRIKPHAQDLMRWINSFTRPRGDENRRKLEVRGESLDALIFREARLTDVPALAELHVTTWNATYNVTVGGPTVATRAWQWTQILANPLHGEFILLIENPKGRLVGFLRAKKAKDGEWQGNLSKIYLRWEYHGLGLGRQMMGRVARWFIAHGVENFVLFAERSNPTIGFYDRLGGERLLDEHGQFHGGYGWRDLRKLSEACPE